MMCKSTDHAVVLAEDSWGGNTMAAPPVMDITELAVLGEQFPLRLMQLGFRLMQVMDAAGRDLCRYVIPPVCTMPAGSFLMGSTRQRVPEACYYELPQREVLVPALQIGKYPVTVVEYACVVEAGAGEEPTTHGGITWQQQQHYPDHPVVGISWHDARAYARWLAHVTGQGWRLPTEAEWEKAARGTDGRLYPWGNRWNKTKANTDDGGPNTTTPIGTYADKGDASPYGAHDMVGNVAEWTSTIGDDEWFPNPYRGDDGREDEMDTTSQRVLRGCHWHSPVQEARVARRAFRPSDLVDFRVGMRLALTATGDLSTSIRSRCVRNKQHGTAARHRHHGSGLFKEDGRSYVPRASGYACTCGESRLYWIGPVYGDEVQLGRRHTYQRAQCPVCKGQFVVRTERSVHPPFRLLGRLWFVVDVETWRGVWIHWKDAPQRVADEG
jgi:formylglycine-generating enzyme required for sulfatase activity